MDDNSLKKVIAKKIYDDGKAFLKTLEKSQPKTKLKYSTWLVAASIALLLGVGSIYLWQSSNFTSTENLYTTYYSPYPNNYKPVVRGETDETTLAFMAYENGNYRKSAALLRELLAEKDNKSLRFYYAISLLELEEHTKALEVLNALENMEFQYQKQVLWYKGLLLLKMNKPEEAKQVFNTIKSQFPEFKTKSIKSVLDRL